MNEIIKMAKSEKKLYKIIKQKINDNNYTDLEKIACMIFVIGMNRSFSSKFHWNTEKYKIRFYEKYRKKRFGELNRNQIICISAARLLKNIAKKFNIDIYYLGAISGILSYDNFSDFTNGEHIIPVYKISDKHYISVDLERNLDNIQTHKKWFNFGRKDDKKCLINLTNKQLTEIMKKIRYIKKNRNEYFDVYISKVIDKFRNNLNENLKKIIYDNKIADRAAKLNSSVDIYRFYKKIINEFHENNNSKEKIYLFGGRSKCIAVNKYCFGIYYTKEKIDEIWLWNHKNNCFISLSRKEFEYIIRKRKVSIVCPKENVGNIFNSKYNNVLKNNVSYKLSDFFMK